ncbi:MAG TPA: LuxR C-terminal-related transcriptional regulator [Solirubrobacteraceae bacterium]|nr:LuxR C-terminal-related transcriptional regulator [Solirubrobacteraceae bacterium]
MFDARTSVPRAGPTRIVRERVGLLDDGPGSEHELATIRAILQREGFAPIVLERELAGVPGARSAASPSALAQHAGAELAAIVLWLAQGAEGAAGVLERLFERFARTPVVLACASIERRELRGALGAGAAGVVVGEELDDGLGACVRAVRAGQLCVPRRHWREIEPPALSLRERQVLGLVAMGCMNRQIADRLFLAESTVKSHLSSAFAKLGVRSRSEAAELILNRERGLDIALLSGEGDTRAPVATATGAR